MLSEQIAKLSSDFARFRIKLNSLGEGQRLILEQLELIKSLVTPPPLPPAPVVITEWVVISEREVIGDDKMAHKMLTYKAQLPKVETKGTPNFDVDRQRVVVLVDDVEADNQVLPVLATEVTFEVESGKSVQLKRSLLDNDDLEGPHVASQTFIAKGNIPPTAPGEFGAMEVIGEREIEHDPVEPPTE